MGADIKSIKNRIRSIDSTLHVTKAMQLVASSKIKRAAEAASGASSYSDAVCAAMHDLVSPETAGSVFVAPKESGKTNTRFPRRGQGPLLLRNWQTLSFS